MDIKNENNVHKLLRIVWVYLDHGGEGKGVDQGELPEELAMRGTSQELTYLNDPKNLEEKPAQPLTYDDAKAALDRLYELFRSKDFDLELPWPNSNPCAGGKPKYRA